MSRIDLSPEQLDAMAQARREEGRKLVFGAEWEPRSVSRQYGYSPIPSAPPKRAPMPQGLQLSLAVLHASFGDESQIHRLTVSAPPVVRRSVEKREGKHHDYYVPPKDDWEDMEPADQIGRSLSASMVQLIGSIEAEAAHYPPRFPVRKALAEWERTCRRRHRGGHWSDHAERPLCGELLRAHVEHGVSVRWLSDRYAISYPRAERLIASGAAFVAERLARWEDEKLGIVHDREHCVVCKEEAG